MLKGVDVSHWNGTINFTDFVKSENSDFIIAKATEGDSFIDCQFKRNLEMSLEHNILFGAYHYLRGDKLFSSQAEHFISVLKEVNSIYNTLIAVDVEDATLLKMSNAEIGDFVTSFCRYIYRETKVWCLVYVSEKFASQNTFRELSDSCGGWIAKWSSHDVIPRRSDLNTSIWQYTSKGSVRGVKGCVDLDIAYMTREAWYKFARGDYDGEI